VSEPERANAARMYDHMLGGAHNFAVDRAAVARVVESRPDAIRATWETRDFMRRVVTWCAEQGIDQFLDLGSGVPSVGNVHEIAHGIDPATRVAYVDNEAVAVRHAEEITVGLDTVTISQRDLRDAGAVLGAPGVAGLLDLDRPVALLALAVLHFVPGDLGGTLTPYLRHLSSGSVLAVSHASNDHADPALTARLESVARAYGDTDAPPTLRSRAEITALFDGLELVPPGVVDLTDWPEPRPGIEPIGAYGAVGRLG
jgi:hypothetical protein